MNLRSKRNAVAKMTPGQGGLEVAAGALLEINLMLAASRESGGEPSAGSYFPVGPCPLDEPPLLLRNTFLATGVIGIVVWSWRIASTREVSG